MKQDLFRCLSSEIFTDILLRLSLRTIATCKCVCKPWLSQIESYDFFKSHLSKSAPAIVVSMPVSTNSNRFTVFKLEENPKPMLKPKPKMDTITEFDFPRASTIQGSANGLLLLKNPYRGHLYVCNPITHEFVELRGPHTSPRGDSYGFGVSRISGQHKVIYLNPKYGCHVYTLEKGASWRSVEATSLSFDRCLDGPVGAFVNGNLHWLLSNNGMSYVCCFDVETECFTTFSPPSKIRYGKLHALGDCLYFIKECNGCVNIWLFEEYKCWRKLHTHIPIKDYSIYGQYASDYLQPIKVYKNGDVLIMLWKEKLFLHYSNMKRSVRQIGFLGKMDDDSSSINPTPSLLSRNRNFDINSILLTPSLLSLDRNLGLENVISF